MLFGLLDTHSNISRTCRLSGSCRCIMSLRVKGSSVSRSFQNLGLMLSSSIACRRRPC